MDGDDSQPSASSLNGRPSRRQERAPKIPEDIWESVKEVIRSRWIEEDMTQDEVLDYLEEHYGLRPSVQQFRSQLRAWGDGFRKNGHRLGKRPASPDLIDQERRSRVAPSGSSMATGQTGGPGYGNNRQYFDEALGAQAGPPYSYPTAGPSQAPGYMTGFPNEMSLMNNNNWVYGNPPSMVNWQGMIPPDPWFGAQGPMGFVPQPFGVYNSGPSPQGYQKTKERSSERMNIIGMESGQPRQPRQPTQSPSKSRQAIHQAVQAGSIRSVELLLQSNPRCAHVLTGEGLTTLWIAAQGGYVDIVNLLISHRVDVNTPSKEGGRTPIHQAAQGGHLKVVQMLLDNNAKADCTDASGLTPVFSAAQEGYDQIIELLLNKSPGIDLEAESYEGSRVAIHQAAQNGHLKVVKLLLDRQAEPDPMDNNGITPLWSAAQQGYHEIVELLLKKGAKPDVASDDGARLPIHQAAQNGSLETVRVLIEHGAEPAPEMYSFDRTIPSPFFLACASGNLEIAKLLLSKGADIGFKMENSGKTALHAAAHGGKADVTEFLIENGCNVDAKEEDGWSALMIAAQEGHLEFVNLLLDKRANVDAEEKDGATALWIASQQGRTDIVRRLVAKGAKQLPTKSARRRPIHQAAQNGHLAVVRILLAADPDGIDAEDNRGATPLILACQENKPSHHGIMKFLLRKGAKPIV